VNPGGRLRELVTELLKSDSNEFEVVLNLNSPGSVFTHKLDNRLKVFVEPQRLNVAESWTSAIKHSEGAYIWLIGDDDFILVEQLNEIITLLKTITSECITFNGWSYIFPSDLTKGQGLSRNRHFRFHKSLLGRLTSNKKISIIKNMYRFVPQIPLNMQLTIFSRMAFNRMGGEFKMPFPDHMALVELLAANEEWEVIDERFCIVGMAPSSFGNSAYSKRDDEGGKYLGLAPSTTGLASGNILYNVMFSWLKTLSSTNLKLSRFQPSLGDFALRQIGFNFRLWRSKEISTKDFLQALKNTQNLDFLQASFSAMKYRNIKLAIEILQRKPGPDKIIGKKFEIVEFKDIKNYADSIRKMGF
jgi:hypothetical protein